MTDREKEKQFLKQRSEKKAMLLSYMDGHLDLLYKALKEENKEVITFQKEKLEKVREGLFEVGFFRES